MPEKQTISPIPVLVGIFTLAGASKLTGAGSARRNFARWGYSPWNRRGVGLLDLGVAAAAVRGLEDTTLRQVAGASTLLLSAGALRSRRRAKDGLLAHVPSLLVGLLGVATLTDTTLVIEP